MRTLVLFSILLALFLPGFGHADRIVFLGDSLTAGYSLDPQYAYPHLVEEKLKAKGKDITVVNAGLSGDTTAGGVRRINWILRQDLDILFIALGANDALRGLPVSEVRKNLKEMIHIAREKKPNVRIILAGMKAPPNMGADYRAAFDRIFPEVAEEESVELMPFLLEGVAGDPALNLADGTHPNRKGQRIIARNVIEILD